MTEPVIFNGDCRDIMEMFIEPNSVDAIVTDPPYGLGFMGKDWDHGVPGVEFWQRAYDVLKPGGHLLAFGGSRTYHRLASAIEDAGFEIRDQIMWIYGSGFPKSLDVSKAIDKAAGVRREVTREGQTKSADDAGKFDSAGSAARERRDVPATDEAHQWRGWGTALKPAHEPIVVARKPLSAKTVAANVLQFGTGAMNIDGCRVQTEDNLNGGAYSNGAKDASDATSYATGVNAGVFKQPEGRWPANLIHDGSDEVLALFPTIKSGGAPTAGDRTREVYGEYAHRSLTNHGSSEGSAARFFYCAKASRKDRNEGLTNTGPQFKHGVTLRQIETITRQGSRPNSPDPTGKFPDHDHREAGTNNHPTVKPTDLMAYLCRLVTPPGGIVLDPFMGSGSTGKAALREGFQFVGIELQEDYFQIARARLAA